MKRSKKSFLIVVCLVFACLSVFGFAACNSESHSHDYAALKYNEYAHWLECDCGEKSTLEFHRGGAATCVKQAICEVCNQEYGNVNEHKYVSLECVNCGEITTECFNFVLLDNNTFEISVKDNTSIVKQLKIPAFYNGKAVTSVGDYAFEGCRGLISVVIPDSITLIGNRAFQNCENLTSVVIGASVTSIVAGAFLDCKSLTSISVNEDNSKYKDIDGNLYSKDETIFIQYAIGKTDASFTIPNSVTSIGEEAFRGCSSLTSIEIPDSITTIAANAFTGCYSLFKRYENCRYLGNQQNPYLVLIRALNNLNSYIIHNETKVVANSAFSGCSNFTSVTIPANVTSIGESAFSACSNLTSIKVSEDNANYKDIDGNLYTKDGTVLIQYAIGKIDEFFAIPNSVTHISEKAFYKCSSLTSVELSDSITLIGDWAFRSCENLTTIELSNSLTSIGERAFSECGSLMSVEIPDLVTSIGEGAFNNCSSLTSVEIGNGVTSMGSYAFAHCCSLTSIIIPKLVNSIGDAPFLDCKSLTSISVSEDNANYKDIGGNLYTKDRTVLIQYAIGKTDPLFIIPDGVIIIGDAFDYCESLISVVIPNGVTSISDFAFNYCTNLTSIAIPNSVVFIGEFAFARCRNLTSIKYSGTQDNWDAILKGSHWDYDIGNYTITYNYTGE